MARYFCLLAAFIMSILTFCPAAAPVNAAENEILTRLPNGLLVYIFRDSRFPLACSRLYVKAGSATEDPAQAGISHVLEHMVFKGTSHRPKGQVAKDVEALGGYLNAATSFDQTWYITDMPAEHWQMGMDVVKDMAFQATLDAAELESEKNVVVSELQRGEDSPMRKLFEKMQVAGLKNTPYGRPIIGFEDSIRAITVDDLRAYVKKWYQPQNMMLLVGGDIDPQKVLAHAQELFGKLENHEDLNLVQPIDLAQAAAGSPAIEVSSGPWNKVYLGMAFPVPGLKDFRSVDLDVLAYLLGGDATAKFYHKYKYEMQLVDSISVGNMSMSRAGLFTIAATLDADKVENFWEELTHDLSALKATAFSQDALKRAKFNLEDGMDRAGETLTGLVSWKGAIQLDFGGKQGEENLRFAQRNVDMAQLQTAIDLWLTPDRARVVVIAPENAQLPDFSAIMTKNWPIKQQAGQKEVVTTAGNGETIDLKDGCKVILLPDNSAPYISLELMMPGGNAILTPASQGLADLTARLLTDGSGEYSKLVLERWLAERAISLSAKAGLQTFGISMDGPSRFNDDIFNMFRNVLFKPRFEAGELQREVNNMKAAIRQRDDRPLSYMFSRIFPFLFPDGQPYGYDKLGNLQTLDTFNIMQVRDFWAKQGGQPWALAIAGNFDRKAALDFATSLAQPHMKRFSVAEPYWNDKSHVLGLTLPGRNQAHLMRIFRTIPATSPDAPGLMLLQSAISGQSGILFTQLRDDQGLGYTVTAFNRSMPQTGFMAFYIGTTPDKLTQSGLGFDKIITGLKNEPLAAETLKSAANQLWGDYIRGRQSLSSRAAEAATNAVLDRPMDFQKNLIEAAQRMTPDEIRDLAAKYLVSPYEVTLKP